MIITQNYGLLRMRFSEEVIAGVSKYKDGKISWECPSNLVPNPGALGYK